MDQAKYDSLKSSLCDADEIKLKINRAQKSLKRLSVTENIKQIKELIENDGLEHLSPNFISSLVHSLNVETNKVIKDLEKQFKNL